MLNKTSLVQGMFLHVVLALGTASAGVLACATLLVLPASAWADPRYVLPALGVMLGGAITSIGTGLAALVEELTLGGPTCANNIYFQQKPGVAP